MRLVSALGRRAGAALAVALIVGGAAACSMQSSGSCYPGDSVACSCAGGGQGFEKCGTDGQYGACSCPSGGSGGAGSGTATSTATASGTTSTTATASGTTSTTATASGATSTTATASGATSTTSSGGMDGGLLPFLAPCTTNAQCATGLCFDYPAKGPHCTMACTTPAQCPPPSTGCNGMGVCKAP